MCGRYAIGETQGEFHDVGLHSDFGDFEPRYNVAPTQRAPVVRLEEGEEQVAELRWGVLPPWAKEANHRPQPINARWEGAGQSKLWRPMLERRCLVPATGYYEWKDLGRKPGKVPHYIHRADGLPLLMAGLWTRWQDLECYAVLTTRPAPEVADIHDRMPLLVTDPMAWLAEGSAEAPPPTLTAHAVSRRVNSVRNEGPELILPDLPEPPAQPSLF